MKALEANILAVGNAGSSGSSVKRKMGLLMRGWLEFTDGNIRIRSSLTFSHEDGKKLGGAGSDSGGCRDIVVRPLSFSPLWAKADVEFEPQRTKRDISNCPDHTA